MKITIPDNNIEERRYILDILLREFLGLEFTLETLRGLQEWVIETNGKELHIEDKFFNRFPEDLSYLKYENIPKRIEELDLFAASFFMLTRWEEYVNEKRDLHGRFPATESLAFRQGFLDRPIVDGYVAELKKALLKCNDNLTFKESRFALVPTHDIDSLYLWKSPKQLTRIMLGDVLKRRSVALAAERLAEYYLVRRGKLNDPFDTFDLLMDKSETLGVRSRFYFMSGGTSIYDNHYKIDDPKALRVIEKIKQRKHIIGIHPSYNTYNNPELFSKEKKRLEEICDCCITEGRQHFLRFEVPTTWQIWEDNEMLTDSSCGYADREGFRCGTGNPFSAFNILTRKKLKLKERPLIFMDSRDYQCGGFTRETQFEHNLKHYLQDYDSTITILFHNDIFRRDTRYIAEYNEIIDLARTKYVRH